VEKVLCRLVSRCVCVHRVSLGAKVLRCIQCFLVCDCCLTSQFLPLPLLRKRRRYCVTRLPSVTLSRCVCEGNMLYPVLSSSVLSRLGPDLKVTFRNCERTDLKWKWNDMKDYCKTPAVTVVLETVMHLFYFLNFGYLLYTITVIHVSHNEATGFDGHGSSGSLPHCLY